MSASIAPESLGGARGFLPTHPAATIFDPKHDRPAVVVEPHGHLGVGRRVADRIVEHIATRVHGQGRRHRQHAVHATGGDSHPALRQGRDLCQRRLCHHGGAGRFIVIERERSVKAGEHQQLFDAALQPEHAFLRALQCQVFAVAFLRQTGYLDVCLDRRGRGAQLMRRIASEMTFTFQRATNACQQSIDGRHVGDQFGVHRARFARSERGPDRLERGEAGANAKPSCQQAAVPSAAPCKHIFTRRLSRSEMCIKI